ncbi:MAG: EAL domain-containing protein [Gallionella sp.]
MLGNSESSKLTQAFFFPAALLMNRLGVTRKFVLLGMMSLAAFAVVMYSLFASLNQDISFMQRELKGLDLIRPFPRAVQALQQHRGLSAGVVGGDGAMRDSLPSMAKEVAKALGDMLEKPFSGVAFGETLQHIRADWERLRKEGHNWAAAENFAAHTRLIERIQSFEVSVADEYALTLDPELDTYYLIDTIVNKLPHAIEHLGRLRAYGTSILAGKYADAQQRVEMNILIAELDDALAILKVNLDKTGRYNPALQDMISAAFGDIAGSARQIAGVVTSDILTGRFSTSPDDFFGMSTAAIDRDYMQLRDALLPMAETLINERIARAENTLRISVGVTLLLFVVAAYFSIGTIRAIVVNIRSLARSAHAFAGGNLEERISLDAHDELGQVGKSFNEMADGFSALLKVSRVNEARLHDLSVNLEERVKQRTVELELAQRLTESLLRRNQALMLTSMDGIHIMDTRGNLLVVNDAFCSMLGYTKEEVSGLNAADWDAQWTAEELQAQFMELAGKSGMFETLWRRKDGKLINVETSASGVELEGQSFIYASSRNITDRKLAENALRESESRYRTLIENSPMCIHEIDTDGRLISMNRAGLLMMGAKDESIVRGLLYLDAVSAADRDRIGELLAKAYAGEVSHFEFKAAGLHERDFKSCFVPVMNSDGSVEKLMGITEDITARKQAEEEIHRLAFYDVLTKLPNRRLFLDRFGTALTASVRLNNFGAVLFIDLDRFKSLNDTLGHGYGDLLLIEVATRIKSCVREMDTVARLGGDEFVVLIEGVSNDQEEASYKVGLVAEKIRESLARPYHLNGHEHQSSPSIGVSLYRGNDESADELLQHADMAMYQAKDAGRNAVRFFDPVMQNNVATRAALVNDLRCAIERRQLHLHYQLQVDNDNRPVGAEALLRWIHPQRGTVMPEQMLPIAEESTLILDIGDWVLETACRQLALWEENEKMRDLVLTVNISAKQFTMPDFSDKVADVLRVHRINPARLKLELTESMALDDLHGTVEKMRALKALGVCLSMDDFGTRYSSLSNLKQLPLDQVKLGRSFVQDVASDGNVALLVQSIIDMSSKYRITVIAEGVENKAQLASLKDRDCVAYQGFLFSKAVPVDEFERLLN